MKGNNNPSYQLANQNDILPTNYIQAQRDVTIKFTNNNSLTCLLKNSIGCSMRNIKFSVTKEIIANETLHNESSKIHTKLIKRTEYPQELSTISQKYKKFLCSIISVRPQKIIARRKNCPKQFISQFDCSSIENALQVEYSGNIGKAKV